MLAAMAAAVALATPYSITYLIGAGARKTKGDPVARWEFAKGDEKWVYCTYDGSAAIQISRRMDDAAQVCELTHRTDTHGSISQMTAVCRSKP